MPVRDTPPPPKGGTSPQRGGILWFTRFPLAAPYPPPPILLMASPMITATLNPEDELHRVFGFPEFRGVQRQVVDRVLGRERTLAVMPTGAGKSLCYQLPSVPRHPQFLVKSP